jgi:hypothetical protein
MKRGLVAAAPWRERRSVCQIKFVIGERSPRGSRGLSITGLLVVTRVILTLFRRLL